MWVVHRLLAAAAALLLKLRSRWFPPSRLGRWSETDVFEEQPWGLGRCDRLGVELAFVDGIVLSAFDQARPGAKLRLVIGPGWLGHPWYRSIELLPETR